MIQLVSSRPLPPSLRGRRLTDPDILLAIAKQFGRGESSNHATTDEFSLVLSDLRMGGTWKRTNQGRLTRTEEMICNYLTLRDGAEASVLDLGASEGLTTLELTAVLRNKFGDRIRVSLADLNIWLFRYRSGPIFEYRAANGEPIMVKIGRFGLRLARKRHDQAQTPGAIAAFYLRQDAFRDAMRRDAEISLIHPLVHSDPAVNVLQLDCLVRNRALDNSYDAVRASNVLNPGYFTRSQIDTALDNIHAYLREGGCLVISRNHDDSGSEIENGSAWRKTGSRFLHLADFGSGSEILSNVDRWQASQA